MQYKNCKLIDGRVIASEIFNETKVRVDDILKKGKQITLADVCVGNDGANDVYVQSKKKKCEEIGITFEEYKLDDNADEEDIINLIKKLNSDDNVNAIFVELPLPKKFDEKKIINTIDYKKDVDGLSIKNIGRLVSGQNGFYPCTAEGIVELLKRSNIEIEGKNCVVLGRSNVVGKPVAFLMLNENATITVCHSKTKNAKDICKEADILIVAIGKMRSIDETYVKDGAIVVDVGIHRIFEDGCYKICGDVDFDKVADKTSYITPVPGGVGAMTTCMLMKHIVDTVMMK